ncbi:hypothetical protein HAX54_034692 [Datura stramonium]|uniref:Pentatricopeptide repeat-containing protein n=1 Tax=Datura stramonium TaxID=4076 RepID=A0ABS8VFH4_DATST|nr:hypothetical protein [Datura stramonium]
MKGMERCSPSIVTYNILLRAFAQAKNVEQELGQKLLTCMDKSGIIPNKKFFLDALEAFGSAPANQKAVGDNKGLSKHRGRKSEKKKSGLELESGQCTHLSNNNEIQESQIQDKTWNIQVLHLISYFFRESVVLDAVSRGWFIQILALKFSCLHL